MFVVNFFHRLPRQTTFAGRMQYAPTSDANGNFKKWQSQRIASTIHC